MVSVQTCVFIGYFDDIGATLHNTALLNVELFRNKIAVYAHRLGQLRAGIELPWYL